MKALNAQTKSLLWPLVTYWLLTLLSLALFLISLTIYDGFDLEAIVVFSSVTIVGIILGQ